MRLRKLESSGAKGDSLLSTEVYCKGHARVGVLFSGGLDSAVIAALAREALPPEEPLDLINVAFQVWSLTHYVFLNKSSMSYPGRSQASKY